jgi:hypothetical protein
MNQTVEKQLKGKKILFVNTPFDGHFNPLTGLAKYLSEIGYDVRWYTSNLFAEKLKKLSIPHFSYQRHLTLIFRTLNGFTRNDRKYWIHYYNSGSTIFTQFGDIRLGYYDYFCKREIQSLDGITLNFLLMNDLNRPLGALEKFFWVLDQTTPVHFVLAAEITGTKPAEAWRKAIEAVRRRHPLMSVCIQESGYQNPMFRQVPNSFIPFRVISGNLQTGWETKLEDELSIPFDPAIAPLLRAVLIQQKGKCIFIMAAHHSVSDGISLTYVFQDILYALSGKVTEHLAMPLSTDELLGFKENGNEVKKQSKITDVEGNGKINFGRSEQPIPRVTRLALTTELTQAIAERARKEGTTVHGALSAAVVLAGRKIRRGWNVNDVRIINPVSIRKASGAGNVCGLYTTSRMIDFKPDRKARFWDLARMTTWQLKGVGEHQHLLDITAALRDKVFGDMTIQDLSDNLQAGDAREVLLSNLGMIPIETTYGNLQLDGIWGPLSLSGHQEEQAIGVSTLHGTLRLAHASRAPMDSLLNMMEMELTAACA